MDKSSANFVLQMTVLGCLGISTPFLYASPVSGTIKAQELAKKGLCVGCHSAGQSSVGPSFEQISERYKGVSNAKELLVGKIRNGGVGVWGAIAMPANRANISDADISTVVDWILTGKASTPNK